MRAEEFLKSGDIDAALSALQADVRSRPADPKLRIFLFQLLCVMGDWKRAITQLKVSAELDQMATPMAQTYREAIICEVYREKVFAGEKDPLVFGEPQEWVALLVEAMKALAAGRADEAATLRDRAFDAAPAVTGTLNGERFEWVADADMRLGPVLEAVVNGRYFWMPFNAVAKITADEPRDLRDCVWTPVNIILKNGGDIVALLPTRYAGTAERGTAAHKLARATDWAEAGGGAFTGIGQRLLATDAGDTALMDLRNLVVDQQADGAT
ncbi:MAG: virulence protein SciE type [Paracoccaceae bacterium]|nr:MAG: virulence protein SciE type [Paracoccaceae bacterium]